jgi:nucleotide-binding universal stress UspA family protein
LSGRARSILVGFDGSDAATRALDAAVDISGYGSRLTLVHVAPDGDGEHPNGVLDRARERLVRRQIQARYLERSGDAGRTLLEAAESIGADVVVVGRRERNALRRLWLGSVSARVVRRAECDVLVVH